MAAKQSGTGTALASSQQHSEADASPETALARQRDAFRREGVVAAATRIDRLERCLALLVDHQQQICSAINEDFGNRSRHVSLMIDIYTSVNTIKNARKRLKKWLRPEKRKAPFPLNLFGARAYIHYQPKGVVGLMTPWNVPVNMIFSPLSDILAAGNRCLIKPSEYTPALATLMAELFSHYFDETEIKVINGDASVGAAFSALPFDHLMFTGATSVGKQVMQAAAQNLTPVTLELGGKSPLIISDQVDMQDAVAKLISGKTMNAGQLCICPDYALVPHTRLEAFLSLCKQQMAQLFPTLRDNPDYVSVINARHYERIQGYISEARERGHRVIELNPANESFAGQQHFRIPLHLIVNPDEDCRVMQDEIFGPILVVRSYRHIDEAIDYINDRPHPLALYYFGKDRDECKKVLDQTIAGGVTINDVMMHFSCDDLPFGGIGSSGMGNYHGREGFRTFSHAKAVLRQGVINLPKLAGTLPPYGPNIDKMMAAQIRK